MDKFFDWAYFLYNYCTDFIINVANLFELSYYEINFIFFCVLYPVLSVATIFFFFTQRIKMKKLKSSSNNFKKV
jgi:hypothetical protein